MIAPWEVVDGVLKATFSFRNFLESMQFVNRVAVAAENANHHPDISISWNRVELVLVTHSAGGLTAKDFDLAEECLQIFAERSSE